MPNKRILFASLILLALAFSACSTPAEEPSPPATIEAAPTDAPAPEATQAPSADAAESASTGSDFSLSSSAMEDGGSLPVTYTCDGDNLSPPLAWQGAPEGTVSYALAMHHVPGEDDTHWYWVVYDIPATIEAIEAGQSDFGSFGTNSVNDQPEYAPPCSQGPGEKLYTFTIYALSANPDLSDPATVDRDTLLAAIADITLAEASMDVTYERSEP